MSESDTTPSNSQELDACLDQICKRYRCSMYSKGCHNRFGHFNLPTIRKNCWRPETKSLLYAYFNQIDKLVEANKEDREVLGEAIQNEFKSALEADDSEHYVECNEENPALTAQKQGWFNEVKAFYDKMQSGEQKRSIESQKLIDDFYAQFSPQTQIWEASIYSASKGVLTAVLIPRFNQPNQNNFGIDVSNKQNLLMRLNSGLIPLRDTHERSLKSILGKVKRGWEESDGSIKIEAELTDKEVSKILKDYGETNVGVSLAGAGDPYCSVCGKKLESTKGACPVHKDASLNIRNFLLREVSLTTEPAWLESKLESYKEEAD